MSPIAGYLISQQFLGKKACTKSISKLRQSIATSKSPHQKSWNFFLLLTFNKIFSWLQGKTIIYLEFSFTQKHFLCCVPQAKANFSFLSSEGTRTRSRRFTKFSIICLEKQARYIASWNMEQNCLIHHAKGEMRAEQWEYTIFSIGFVLRVKIFQHFFTTDFCQT